METPRPTNMTTSTDSDMCTEFLRLSDEDLEAARVKERRKYETLELANQDQLALYHILIDLQSMREEYENGIRIVSHLDLWQDQQVLKEKALTHLFFGLKQHTFLQKVTYLATTKSLVVATNYLKWLEQDGVSYISNPAEAVQRFERICEHEQRDHPFTVLKHEGHDGEAAAGEPRGFDLDIDEFKGDEDNVLHHHAKVEDDDLDKLTDNLIQLGDFLMASSSHDDQNFMLSGEDVDPMAASQGIGGILGGGATEHPPPSLDNHHHDQAEMIKFDRDTYGMSLKDSYVLSDADLSLGLQLTNNETREKDGAGLTELQSVAVDEAAKNLLLGGNRDDSFYLSTLSELEQSVNAELTFEDHAKAIDEEVQRLLQMCPEEDHRTSFQCHQCIEAFDSQDQLDEHEKTHAEGIIASPSDSFQHEQGEALLNMEGVEHEGSDVIPPSPEVEPPLSSEEEVATAAKQGKAGRRRVGRKKRNHECPFCGRHCVSRSKLTTHMVVHTGERRFKCDVCGKTFSYKKALMDHRELHSNRSFPCPVCGVITKQRSQMSRHLRKVHKITTKDVLYQSFTGFSPEELKEAEDSCLIKVTAASASTDVPLDSNDVGDDAEPQQQQPTDVAPQPATKVSYPCPVCRIVWSSRADMLSHLRLIHQRLPPSEVPLIISGSDPTNYVDEDDAGGEAMPAALLNNNWINDNAADSNKTAMRTKSLEDPGGVKIGKTTRKRRYECHLCGKVCVSNFKLTAHIRMHTGERPFKCDVCPKDFTTKASLSSHKELHSNIGFSCSICDTVCNQKNQLLRHFKRVHRVPFPNVCPYIDEVSPSVAVATSVYPQSQSLGPTSNVNDTIAAPTTKERGQIPSENGQKPQVTLYEHNCAKCGQIFPIKSSILADHMRQHDSLRSATPVNCPICQKTFRAKKRNSLLMSSQVIRSVKDGKTYECDACEQMNGLDNDLMRHMAANHPSAAAAAINGASPQLDDNRPPLESGDEPQLFEIVNDLELEMSKVLQHDDNNAVNVEADDNKSIRNSLTGGQDDDADMPLDRAAAQEDMCPDCGELFTNRVDFWNHVKNHFNSPDDNEPGTCPVCDFTFKTREAWVAHCDLHLSYLFQCKSCNRSFSSKEELYKHMYVTHPMITIKNKFHCHECGMSFNCSRSLRLHNRTHQGLNTCPICKKTCRSVARHIERDHKDADIEITEEMRQTLPMPKPFMCTLCGKCFNRQRMLEDHNNHHLGIRPHKCDVCPKSFASRMTLYLHRQIHSSRKFPCQLCNKQFNTTDLLSKHKRSKHAAKIES